MIHRLDRTLSEITDRNQRRESRVDAYFSADVETDGPIPGPYSMLSFALVYAGSFDGRQFRRPDNYVRGFYRELKPISENFEPEALRVNGLDRERLRVEGDPPAKAMTEASGWVRQVAGASNPVLIAYPVSLTGAGCTGISSAIRQTDRRSATPDASTSRLPLR